MFFQKSLAQGLFKLKDITIATKFALFKKGEKGKYHGSLADILVGRSALPSLPIIQMISG
jgi:hypothetical protein